MGKTQFRIPLIHLAISIGVAAFITLFGRFDKIPLALVTPRFYAAFISSTMVCYLLLSYNQFVNRKLNEAFPYTEVARKRIWMQILLGIIGSIFLDLLLVSLYYLAIGRSLWQRGFLTVDFAIAVLLIAIINIVYLVIEAVTSKKHSQKAQEFVPFVLSYNGVHVNFNPETDILYLQRAGKLVKLVATSGTEYAFKDSIVNLKKQLGSNGFCQINQSVLVNLNTINGYTSRAQSKNLDLLFKAEYQTVLDSKDTNMLQVTRSSAHNFRKHWEKHSQ
ncbi:LytTR family DNA-binding domain-containing protein [Fluviicola sp.]|uniref:LytTR family DNA-binding domain-containing protein n=1 Tax=Fluviicola sp. TaxID=1917219 RepID=UPI0031D650FC